MKKYPEASYEILKDEDTKMPYFSSELGIMCFTRVTIEGISSISPTEIRKFIISTFNFAN
jgi:hypothetical protein